MILNQPKILFHQLLKITPLLINYFKMQEKISQKSHSVITEHIFGHTNGELIIIFIPPKFGYFLHKNILENISLNGGFMLHQ
jgi:hypothetical protein